MEDFLYSWYPASFYVLCALSFAIAYLLGSVNTSIIVGKIFGGNDIRDFGSGSAGATNALRTYGKKAAVFATLGDILKAVIAILLTKTVQMYDTSNCLFGIDLNQYFIYAAGIGVILGHNFPVYFKFKGGKGVLVSIVALMFADWRIGLIVLAFALLIMVITRYVSLGSVLGSIALVILALIMRLGDWWFFGFSVLLMILIVVMHRENIKRLFNGTERKLGKKKED